MENKDKKSFEGKITSLSDCKQFEKSVKEKGSTIREKIKDLVNEKIFENYKELAEKLGIDSAQLSRILKDPDEKGKSANLTLEQFVTLFKDADSANEVLLGYKNANFPFDESIINMLNSDYLKGEEAIGKKLEEKRIQEGISVNDMCSILDCNKETYKIYEGGLIPPNRNANNPHHIKIYALFVIAYSLENPETVKNSVTIEDINVRGGIKFI